tara:strand:+ start:152 stop:2074 length:1923 start_codon:yes stop_codon:yes gene_type:complete
MDELILVLEENPEIQAVISASLKDSPVFINQELDPDYFFQQVQNLNPDLIFLSNSDRERNYRTCRNIREDPAIKNIPVILLVNAKDEINEDALRELKINGMLRKPFEASMLKEQISQYISLDENFGAEPDKENDNFAFDMSSIDSDLKDIKQQNQDQSHPASKGADAIHDLVQKSQDSSSAVSAGSKMDSLVLEDILIDPESKGKISPKEDMLPDESEKTPEDPELGIDDEYNFDLKSEEKIEDDSYKEKPETHSTETDLVPGGLEKLKLSGLEEKYAESRLFNKNEETEQKLRSGLTDIDLEKNDFEDPSVIWSHPPDLEQTPREGLTDISLKQTDFHPSFPKHLASLDGTSETIRQEDEAEVEQISEMDDSLLQTGREESSHVKGNALDDILLTDSEEKEAEEDDNIVDAEQFVMDSSLDEFDEGFIDNRDDDEISSMVRESIDDQEIISSETSLEELEDLSLQMESLESEEDELEAEEKEFETDLDKARILNEGITADYQEDELTEFMVDELGDLLELDEDEESDEMEQDYLPASEITYALEEDVFVSWDEAEEAFMGFDKDSVMTEDADWTDTETGTEKSLGKDYFSDKEGRYSFNEDELKDIVTSSVQNALEKSIASSLVELAVSEIKNNVSGRV